MDDQLGSVMHPRPGVLEIFGNTFLAISADHRRALTKGTESIRVRVATISQLTITLQVDQKMKCCFQPLNSTP